MRKARYDMKQVICKNASLIGSSTCIARPGYWIHFKDGGPDFGRVLGRVAKTDGYDCKGWLAVVVFHGHHGFCGFRWVDPDDVRECYPYTPHKILAWLTGPDWVKSKADIARIIAMSEHGTLSEDYIDNRDKPDQAYNARPEYVQQFLLD